MPRTPFSTRSRSGQRHRPRQRRHPHGGARLPAGAGRARPECEWRLHLHPAAQRQRLRQLQLPRQRWDTVVDHGLGDDHHRGRQRTPVAVADGATTAEDTALVVAAPRLRSNDTDVDTALASLVASVVSQPAHGTAIVNGNGSYTYTPTLNYNGPDNFTYRVFDGAAFSSAVTVTLTVTPVNDAPVGGSDAYSANEDVPLVVAAGSGVLADDTDVDSASLTAALVAGPSHGTLPFRRPAASATRLRPTTTVPNIHSPTVPPTARCSRASPPSR